MGKKVDKAKGRVREIAERYGLDLTNKQVNDYARKVVHNPNWDWARVRNSISELSMPDFDVKGEYKPRLDYAAPNVSMSDQVLTGAKRDRTPAFFLNTWGKGVQPNTGPGQGKRTGKSFDWEFGLGSMQRTTLRYNFSHGIRLAMRRGDTATADYLRELEKWANRRWLTRGR